MDHPSLQQHRDDLLEQMRRIDSMERGSLSEFARKGGKAGPYYKRQCWRNGRNETQYVATDEVEPMREAIANHERFQNLAEEFVETTVQMTRQNRAIGDEGKKNSKKLGANASKRPKPSSRSRSRD